MEFILLILWAKQNVNFNSCGRIKIKYSFHCQYILLLGSKLKFPRFPCFQNVNINSSKYFYFYRIFNQSINGLQLSGKKY